MKQYLLVLLLMLFFGEATYSQYDSPSKFGKVTLEELELKDCEFEKGVAAMVLFDYSRTHMDPTTYNVVTERHRRIKIFNAGGYKWANHTIGFDDDTRIMGIKAMTHFLKDGKVVSVKMGKENIFKEKVSDTWEERKLSLKNIQEGCVIEYVYTLSTDESRYLPRFRFQTSIPVKHSEYSVSHPNNVVYLVKYPVGFPPSKQRIDNVRGQYHWVYKNLPSFKMEPFMTTSDDYILQVQFQLSYYMTGGVREDYFRGWPQIADRILDSEYLGARPRTNTKYAKKAQELCASLTDSLEMAETIYNFVRDSISFNGDESVKRGQFIWQTYAAKEGNTADLTMLLMQMLRAVEIPANPVVVSRRSNRKLVMAYPMLEYIDYPIVHSSIGGKSIFLDATDPNRPFGLLPYDCLNGAGMLIDFAEKRHYFVEVANQVSTATNYFGRFTLSEDGTLSGNLSVGVSGYRALANRKKIDKLGEEKFLEEYANSHFPQAELKKQAISNTDRVDETLKMSFDLSADDYVEASDELIYLSPMLGLNTESNPFKQEKRGFPIDFGNKSKVVVRMMYTIPEGYELDLENLNTAMKTTNGEVSFRYTVSVAPNLIVVSSVFSINSAVAPANQYDAIKGIMDQVIEKQSTSLVLKLKS